MTDVARLAGVSQSSVSLVLNNMTGARIAEATRERVLRIASEIGYALPAERRRLQPATARNTIAFVIDEISTSPHPVVSLDGVRDQSWESGYLVATHVTRSNPDLEEATMAAIRNDDRVLGIIYATIFTRAVAPPANIGALPLILLNCYPASSGKGAQTLDLNFTSVVPGEILGGFAAAQYLIRNQHRRIGFINGEVWMDAAADRLTGYCQALAQYQIPFDPGLIMNGDWLPLGGAECAARLLALDDPPTAIFCANDLMAIGAMSAAQDAGRRVPHDLSIIGYDDQELARYTQPPLTTVVLPNYAMGRRAAKLLIDTAQTGKVLSTEQFEITGPVVERGTVRPLGSSGSL